MKKYRSVSLLVALAVVPTMLMASTFWKSGKVTRILTDNGYYGKCMIRLSFSAVNGCRGNWVSLDCEGKYLDKGDGDRMLNIALVAQNMNKKVSVKIDSSKKFAGYCVATRIDILK
jgi:hypothetical protein